MNKITHAAWDGINTFTEDARAVMAATAYAAGKKVGQARERLAAVLEGAREMACDARDTAVAGAKATDQAVRRHPYPALAIGAAVGGLLGFLFSRRASKHRKQKTTNNK